MKNLIRLCADMQADIWVFAVYAQRHVFVWHGSFDYSFYQELCLRPSLVTKSIETTESIVCGIETKRVFSHCFGHSVPMCLCICVHVFWARPSLLLCHQLQRSWRGILLLGNFSIQNLSRSSCQQDLSCCLDILTLKLPITTIVVCLVVCLWF